MGFRSRPGPSLLARPFFIGLAVLTVVAWVVGLRRDGWRARAADIVREVKAEPSMIAKPIPDEHRLVITRDHISPGDPGTGYGVILHEGEVVDARATAVKELSKIDKSLFSKPAAQPA